MSGRSTSPLIAIVKPSDQRKRTRVFLISHCFLEKQYGGTMEEQAKQALLDLRGHFGISNGDRVSVHRTLCSGDGPTIVELT